MPSGYHRRLLLLPWLLLSMLATAGFGPPVITDGGYPPLRMGQDDVAALVRLAEPPPVTAAAALLFDLDSERTLYALRPNDPLLPASTAKLMTALVVLQQANLDDVAVVSAYAAGTSGSRMGLVAGETLPVRDLLIGLLLPSGNDAAVALAEHVAGSEAAFVALMNQTAAALGLSETQFANAHGLDAPGQTTSASDLVLVTKAALAYPYFAQVVALSDAQVAGRALTNTNELLNAYRGADGVKTGTTEAAGECLVASVTRRGHRILAVVLGSADRYADVTVLLDYAAVGWRWGSAGLPDDALAWTRGPEDRLYRLRAVHEFDIYLPAWQWRIIEPVRRVDASAPLTGTLPVGELHWMLGAEIVATVPLQTWPGP